jgi:hypothetical protein
LKKSNRSGQILHLAMTHFEEATSWQAVWKMAQNGENTNRMLLTGPQQKLDLAFEVRSNVQEAQLEKFIEKNDSMIRSSSSPDVSASPLKTN